MTRLASAQSCGALRCCRSIDHKPLRPHQETILKLKVNPAKTKVAPMSECGFLGSTIKGKKLGWTDKAEPRHKQS